MKNLKKLIAKEIWVIIKKEPATYKNYRVKPEEKRAGNQKKEKGEWNKEM